MTAQPGASFACASGMRMARKIRNPKAQDLGNGLDRGLLPGAGDESGTFDLVHILVFRIGAADQWELTMRPVARLDEVIEG